LANFPIVLFILTGHDKVLVIVASFVTNFQLYYVACDKNNTLNHYSACLYVG